MPSPSPQPSKPRSRRRRILIFLLVAGLVFVIALVVAAMVAAKRAEPLLKAKVIETLAARFHSRVELDSFQVSIHHGVRVRGEGLRLYGSVAGEDSSQVAGTNARQANGAPLIAVRSFQFTAGLLGILRTPVHVHRVDIQGLELNVPPHEQRLQTPLFKHGKPARIRMEVDRLECDDTTLLVFSSRPDKPPLHFNIQKLVLRRVAPGQPMQFDAVLVNPKPVGDIQSHGSFGPWHAEAPQDTAVEGSYTFTNADLSTLRGISGILSSRGQYNGTVGQINVEGETDTPDFSLNIAGHKAPLHTHFHALVDGTSGDTYLDPVDAQLLHTPIVARGFVERRIGIGHEIKLDVQVNNGRIEDLLALGVRTQPAVMTGGVSLKTNFDLQPGHEEITRRLTLSGSFRIEDGHLRNPKFQEKVDDLSWRSRGQPKIAQEPNSPAVLSDINGKFALKNAVLSFPKLQFEVPGTEVNLSGTYSLDGKVFDFHGKVRMQAKLSQMIGGWKHILLKPVDPFFSKPGAGTEIPIKITGTESAPRFGLDFGHK